MFWILTSYQIYGLQIIFPFCRVLFFFFFPIFKMWSSCHGSVVTSLTSIHEDLGLIPGLTQWAKDPALRSAVV